MYSSHDMSLKTVLTKVMSCLYAKLYKNSLIRWDDATGSSATVVQLLVYTFTTKITSYMDETVLPMYPLIGHTTKKCPFPNWSYSFVPDYLIVSGCG